MAIEIGDKVSFHRFKDGKYDGDEEEIFEVKDFVDIDDNGEWAYMKVDSLIDGRSIWTTEESVTIKFKKDDKNFKYFSWHKIAQEKTKELFDNLKKEFATEKFNIEYQQSYWVYFKKTELNEMLITIEIKKYESTGIHFSSMMFETNKPYKLRLWKYNGEHEFKDYDVENINNIKWDSIYQYIAEFFKIKREKEERYEQLSFF